MLDEPIGSALTSKACRRYSSSRTTANRSLKLCSPGSFHTPTARQSTRFYSRMRLPSRRPRWQGRTAMPGVCWTPAGAPKCKSSETTLTHRRAVEVAQEPKDGKVEPHPVTAKEMMVVLNLMSSSPVALFLKQCSVQQKMMMAAMVRCVRREGVPEIPWRAVSPAELACHLVRPMLSFAESWIIFQSSCLRGSAGGRDKRDDVRSRETRPMHLTTQP